MELFARHAHFFDDKLVLDAGADDVRLVNFDKLLHLVMADVVNDQRGFFHLHHHAFVIFEVETAGFQRRDLLRRLAWA